MPRTSGTRPVALETAAISIIVLLPSTNSMSMLGDEAAAGGLLLDGRVGRRGVAVQRVVLALAGGHHREAHRDRQVVELLAGGRLVARGEGVDDALLARVPVEDGADRDVRLHVHHGQVVTAAGRAQGRPGADLRHARGLQHDVDGAHVRDDAEVAHGHQLAGLHGGVRLARPTRPPRPRPRPVRCGKLSRARSMSMSALTTTRTPCMTLVVATTSVPICPAPMRPTRTGRPEASRCWSSS